MREKIRHCRGRSAEDARSGREKTCLEVLYEIIENAKTFRIFAVLDVDQ